MTIRRLVLAASGAVVVVIAAALLTNAHIASLEARVRVVDEQRVRGLELCEEMLQTTNQLTRTVRWYAVFGDPKYETIYRRILSVRSGLEPRPRRIQDDFWMDVMVDRVPPVAKGSPLSLDAMIEQSGIPAAAAEKIRESLRHSDRLAKAEEIAFAARKGRFDDGAGNLVREGPPDELLAKTLLFSRDYEAARDGILRPIQECREVVLGRHAAARAELDRALGTARSVRIAVWAALLVTAVGGALLARKRVIRPVEALLEQTRAVSGDLDALAEATRAAASGEQHAGFAPRARPLRLGGDDEMAALAADHDRMIARLEESGRLIASITEELRSLVADLEVARRGADQANAAKGAFLATMSHEIRTPMNAIINMTALALESELDAKQRRYLSVVDSSARNLLGLINDILDFSKIESGRMDIESAPCDVHHVVEEVAEIFRTRVIEKRIEFVAHVEASVPRRVLGDALRIRQVLVNLVGNAFKFTEKGEVVLRVGLAGVPAADGAIRLAVEVRDTGIGIPLEAQGKLFQEFTQVDSSTSRKYGGTGLGLAITKKLVEKMGGEIRLKSEPGRGTSFLFEIAVKADPEGAASPRGAADGLAGRRVLVVEDNASTRDLLRTLLGMFRMESCEASDGEEGWRSLLAAAEKGARGLDAAVVDWQLPDFSGTELVRRIRAHPTLGSLPVVLVSAFVRPEDQDDALRTGANVFLPKPITASSLHDALLDASGIARREVASTGGSRDEDFGGARVLMAEDNETNQMVAQEILGPAGVVLDIVGDGRAAVEKAVSGGYALVLMDMQMPVMDGIAATKAIRESLGGRAPPIVALTANAMKADVDRCLAAGMVDFVAKPIDRTLLFRTLRKHLPPVPVPRMPRAASPVPTAAASAPAVVDEDAARARLGLSPAAYERILARFREALPTAIAALRDALAQGDREASVRHAHSVAGSAGNVGATALHGAAKALEGALRDGATEHAPALAAVEREAAAALGAPTPASTLSSAPPGSGSLTGDPTRPRGPVDAPESAGGPAAPVAEVRARAAALREALESGDLDSIEAATGALKSLALPPGGAGAVKSVEAAAADFDFERAAAALGEWVKSLR